MACTVLHAPTEVNLVPVFAMYEACCDKDEEYRFKIIASPLLLIPLSRIEKCVMLSPSRPPDIVQKHTKLEGEKGDGKEEEGGGGRNPRKATANFALGLFGPGMDVKGKR